MILSEFLQPLPRPSSAPAAPALPAPAFKGIFVKPEYPTLSRVNNYNKYMLCD